MNPAALTQAFEALHFLRPQWLWALLALPLLAWAWRRHRARADAWRGAVDPHLLQHLLERGEGRRGLFALGTVLSGFALAILALAGPSWRQGEQPLLQGEAPLVVVLDLSSAMLANDLPPSRLLQARAKLATLLDRRSGGQVGLVVFADDAFTVAPLTRDAANVALFLDSLSPEVMPVDGSRPARGIERAAALLEQSGFASGDILVIGSHGGGDAVAAATAARRAGYRVSALGLGTSEGAAYRTAQGAISHARLDATTLRAMAAAGGGRYATLAAGTDDLAALDVLDAAAAARAGASGDRTIAWRDDGYWLLLPLMALALFAFRRGGGAVAALLLCACLPWHAALAADEGTPWRRADQVQHERMQDGTDAYRREDYAAAAQAWDKLPGADAAYNRGTALARAGRYEDAIAAYDEALRLQPGMEDAVANRKIVEDAMKRKPPPSPPGGRGDRQQSPDSGKPDDDKSNPGDDSGKQRPQPEEAGSRDAKDAGKEEGQSRGQSGERDEQEKTPPGPGDADAQRKADEQQRQRMQQALEQQQGAGRDGKEQEGAKGEAETQRNATEQEKQRANEAWLRRVPDDPGGLLRAKFRLEYERRKETGER